MRGWQRRARAIPDPAIRRDALSALVEKRENVEGAALFAILPRRRDRGLLRLLVTYQVMWDFLDSVSERGAHAGQANGRQLHRALVEAIDPSSPISDYYRHHPWKDDGGYLLALVETCRGCCSRLPSHRAVRTRLRAGVARCAVQSLNHEPDASRRENSLRAWARRELIDVGAFSWFELTAAASAFVPYALLAAATESHCRQRELAAIEAAYFPWVGLLIAMLDSYVDLPDDRACDGHSYIAHYPSLAEAVERLAGVIRSTVTRVGRLPDGRRHAIIACAMVAMYLSKESANAPGLRPHTRAMVRAGGPQTVLMLSLVGVWRLTLGRRLAVAPGAALPPSLRVPQAVQTLLFWRMPFVFYRVCRDRHGDHFTLRALDHPPMVFLSDPRAVGEFLAAPPDVLHPGEGGTTIEPIVGSHSFMLQDEDEHLSGRRAVLPALSKRTVELEREWVLDSVSRDTSAWPMGVPIRLHPRLRALTLEVALRRIFAGEDSFGVAVRLPLLRERVLAMLDVTAGPLLSLPLLRRGPGAHAWRRFLGDRAAVDEVIHVLIERHLRRRGPEAQDGEGGGGALGGLIAARSPDGASMTRAELRDNAMSLILAGHETTASQLAWAFQLLAHNPRVQQRLIDEVDEGAGEEYLTATIKEVLRHRPVFLFTIPRAVKRPIEIDGWVYEPPVHLLGCIYLLHHDPRVYPEPELFRPERFLEGGQPGPYAWLPWGGGRRRCPGSHLALLEMKTVLRTVLESMTVHPASRRMERPRWRSVIVTPHAGSRVVLRPRAGGSTSTTGIGRRWRRTREACPVAAHCHADDAESGR